MRRCHRWRTAQANALRDAQVIAYEVEGAAARVARLTSTLCPLRLLAQKIGKGRVIADVLPRLRCSHCGSRPKTVELMEDAGDGAADRVPPWRLVLAKLLEREFDDVPLT